MQDDLDEEDLEKLATLLLKRKGQIKNKSKNIKKGKKSSIT
ncbi:MAG: hypothetical protein ACJ705_03690 [Nitrososphaeraceae archaeon]